ncbi:hypothetical protein P154DRAFT_579444 [Amniculicola lignicola CBS 123094]|uniref:Uncharacterized protein n=1 Tax=Amniculicola lignicola CBS 123094 TaxID=1392246 RepID=A0A6A5W658_9PLEO|nr:hypothetical protein P154DRAFT_579444 [Amniculicola lignicola CBS 123094]
MTTPNPNKSLRRAFTFGQSIEDMSPSTRAAVLEETARLEDPARYAPTMTPRLFVGDYESTRDSITSNVSPTVPPPAKRDSLLRSIFKDVPPRDSLDTDASLSVQSEANTPSPLDVSAPTASDNGISLDESFFDSTRADATGAVRRSEDGSLPLLAASTGYGNAPVPSSNSARNIPDSRRLQPLDDSRSSVSSAASDHDDGAVPISILAEDASNTGSVSPRNSPGSSPPIPSSSARNSPSNSTGHGILKRPPHQWVVTTGSGNDAAPAEASRPSETLPASLFLPPIHDFSGDIKDLRTTTANLSSKIKDLDTRIVSEVEDRSTGLDELRGEINKQDERITTLEERFAEQTRMIKDLQEGYKMARQEREILRQDWTVLRVQFDAFQKGMKGKKRTAEEANEADEAEKGREEAEPRTKRQKTQSSDEPEVASAPTEDAVPARSIVNPKGKAARQAAVPTPTRTKRKPHKKIRATRNRSEENVENENTNDVIVVDDDEVMTDVSEGAPASAPTSVDQMPVNILQGNVVQARDRVDLPDEVDALIKGTVDYVNTEKKRARVLGAQATGNCARCIANGKESVYAVGEAQTSACKTCTNLGKACLLVNGDGSLTLLPAVHQIRGEGFGYWKAVGVSTRFPATKKGIVWNE